MRHRARVDENQPAIVRGLRRLGVHVLHLHQLGHGAPDILTYHPWAGLKLMEIKDPGQPPSARKLTPAEEAFGREWPVAVVETLDEAFATARGKS